MSGHPEVPVRRLVSFSVGGVDLTHAVVELQTVEPSEFGPFVRCVLRPDATTPPRPVKDEGASVSQGSDDE